MKAWAAWMRLKVKEDFMISEISAWWESRIISSSGNRDFKASAEKVFTKEPPRNHPRAFIFARLVLKLRSLGISLEAEHFWLMTGKLLPPLDALSAFSLNIEQLIPLNVVENFACSSLPSMTQQIKTNAVDSKIAETAFHIDESNFPERGKKKCCATFSAFSVANKNQLLMFFLAIIICFSTSHKFNRNCSRELLKVTRHGGKKIYDSRGIEKLHEFMTSPNLSTIFLHFTGKSRKSS